MGYVQNQLNFLTKWNNHRTIWGIKHTDVCCLTLLMCLSVHWSKYDTLVFCKQNLIISKSFSIAFGSTPWFYLVLPQVPKGINGKRRTYIFFKYCAPEVRRRWRMCMNSSKLTYSSKVFHNLNRLELVMFYSIALEALSCRMNWRLLRCHRRPLHVLMSGFSLTHSLA